MAGTLGVMTSTRALPALLAVALLAGCGGDEESGTEKLPAATERCAQAPAGAPDFDQACGVLMTWYTGTDETARCEALSESLQERVGGPGCPNGAGTPLPESDFEVVSASYEPEEAELLGFEVLVRGQACSVGLTNSSGSWRVGSIYNCD